MAASLNNLTQEISTVSISDTEEEVKGQGQVPLAESGIQSVPHNPVCTTTSQQSVSIIEEILIDTTVVPKVLNYLQSLQCSHLPNKTRLDTEGESALQLWLSNKSNDLNHDHPTLFGVH